MSIVAELISKVGTHFTRPTEASFAEHAARVLAEFPPEILGTADCLSYYRARYGTEDATHSHFSDEGWTLYSDSNFMVELYRWIKRDTGIHDHHFEGAFQFLDGTGDQFLFTFGSVQTSSVPAPTRGSLRCLGQDTLAPGMVRRIEEGTGFIHLVMHYPPRGHVLCVRTHRRHGESLNVYLFPGLQSRLHQLAPSEEAVWVEFIKTLAWHEQLGRSVFDGHFLMAWAAGTLPAAVILQRWGEEQWYQELADIILQHRAFLLKLQALKSL
jgi:hypothetical protein